MKLNTMALIRSVILAAVIFVSSAAIPSARILGGEEASKNSFLYATSVRLDGAHNCGGSIIGYRSILTAAHCFMANDKIVSLNRLAVRVGSTNQFSGGKVYSISKITIHPNYTAELNDIAVLTLESPLVWTERVNKIDIATSSADVPAAGDLVTVAGWGEQSFNTSFHKLHYMSFSTATEDECSNAFSKASDANICLAHGLKKGGCVGDAGNGAVYKEKLIGVSSFIVGACGSRYPDVFSKVAYHAPWIKSVLV